MSYPILNMLLFSIHTESLLRDENVTFCLFRAALSIPQRSESAVADEEGFYESLKFEATQTNSTCN